MSVAGRAPGLGIIVVVPVRNEERRLSRCLTALSVARRRLPPAQQGGPLVRVVVVLDRCTDRSAEIAGRWPGVETVVSDLGRVGAARAAGVDFALSTSALSLSNTWIACTDGDSVVPADWLRTQLRYAGAATDLVLGTVRPDPRELSRAALDAWYAGHDLREGHPHVFGANLGIRADAYLRVGGFADVSAHEDQLLVAAVRAAGGRIVATAANPVLTSARIAGRTPAGFAHYLQHLILGGVRQDGRTSEVVPSGAVRRASAGSRRRGVAGSAVTTTVTEDLQDAG